VKRVALKGGVLLIMVFWTGLWLNPALAGSYQVTGEITIKYEANETSQPLHAPSGATVTGKGRSTLHSMTTKAKVCIQDGKAMLGDVTHDLKWLQEADVKTVYNKTDCTPIHRTRSNLDIRRPGNWEREMLNLKQVILEPEVAKKKFKTDIIYKPAFSMNRVSDGKHADKTGSARQGGMPAGRYSLSFETKVFQAMSGYSLSQRHNVCTGVTTEKRLEYKPVPPGSKPDQVSFVSENSNTVILANPYMFTSPLGGYASTYIDFNPNGCSGSQTLLKEKKPHFEQTMTVHWQFKPNDPCPMLIDTILHDLAYAEAYQDPKTREKTKDMEQYKCYVDRKAYEILYKSPPPAGVLECDKKTEDEGKAKGSDARSSSGTSEANHEGEGGVGDEIGVDENCQLKYKEAYGEKAEEDYQENGRRNCIPKEVVEGIIAHEKTHQSQCRTDKARYNAKDTTIWGNMEVAAHLIGIDHMLKSLKRLCPEYWTGQIEEKIKEINRKRLKP
jgi:hypothetical protein